MRFYPTDGDAFLKAGLRVRLNSRGGAQLRLEGIDALETHYQSQAPGGGRWHQHPALAKEGADALLRQLGFRSVERDEDGTVVSASPESVPGHILTRFADKYGRPVSFAFRGQRGRAKDGSQVHLDAKGVANSANFEQLAAGHAFPTFYSLLYVDLRQAMADAATAAREKKAGIWAHDVSTEGFRLTSRKQLQEEVVLLPKLFRRLVDYLGLDESGGVSLANFARYLDTRDDRLFTTPDGHATELATLVEVKRQQLRLTVDPERIVFLEA
ncbi:nuclease [Amycolatopsis albispora]|uniref:nuclease n=1 Tax=Amycolatopsis albispora TaxID=1804986 RepID=UPI001F272A59|nr:nuclease [Amycolatopsis albispora]